MAIADFIRQHFGEYRALSLPVADPLAYLSDAFRAAAAQARGAATVLFDAMPPRRLDDFFHLRLVQILRGEAAFPALSVVLLQPDDSGPHLAGGFAARFRTGWPFQRCVFVAMDAAFAAAAAVELGMPVAAVDDAATPPTVLNCDIAAEQKIGLQIQPIWGRCGSTTAFQNQVEDLVASGRFTIRIFAECDYRRGATLTHRARRIIPENDRDAGAHINVVAVPPGLDRRLPDEPHASWATALLRTDRCVIEDSAVRRAAGKADIVIANHVERVGLGLQLARTAALILDVHDDLADAHAQIANMGDEPAPGADEWARAAADIQRAVLPIPDLCTHVSLGEEAKLRQLCRNTAIVLPRPYVRPVKPDTSPRYDILIVGDQHAFNIQSVQWFIEQVWQPHLQPCGIQVAIVGRVVGKIDTSRYGSPLLHFLGFVDDLEAVRAACRMTVVPDQGGTGIPVKTLTTLAQGHPMSVTTAGLRGFDPATIDALPACDGAMTLAQDILHVLQDPATLAARAALVRCAYKALHTGRTYCDLMAVLEAPSDDIVAQRMRLWQAALARAEDTPPAQVTTIRLDDEVLFSGTDGDQHMLLAGWHDPEEWGRWMDGADASFRLSFAAPVDLPLRLQMHVVLPPAPPLLLTVRVDGVSFEPVQPRAGRNVWKLPAKPGRSSLIVDLHVSATLCPADTGTSPDDRVLGLGIASVQVVALRGATTQEQSPYRFRLGETFPMNETEWDDQVLAEGWHGPEAWGRWMDGTEAALALAWDEPATTPLGLDLDLVPSPVGATLTAAIDGHRLATIEPKLGSNIVILPLEQIAGRSELVVRLKASAAVCPAEVSNVPDPRRLGVGVRGVRLLPRVPTNTALNTVLPVNAATAPWDLLVDGWHAAEDWGCWGNGSESTLRLNFAEPLRGSVELVLELALPAPDVSLVVSVNGQVLPESPITSGANRWIVPDALATGAVTFAVGLTVSRTVKPSEAGASGDDRVLGIGLRSIYVMPLHAPVIPLDRRVMITAASVPPRLLARGWHPAEAWGCWACAAESVIQLGLAVPLRSRVDLVLDLIMPAPGMAVDVAINGRKLTPAAATEGEHRWPVPGDATEGADELTVALTASRTVRPSESGTSSDDRLLGVGLRALRIVPRDPPVVAAGQMIPVDRDNVPPRLLWEGWHPPEDWGCWSNGADATLRLRVEPPPQDGFLVQLDLAALPDPQPVTLRVNGQERPSRLTVTGRNIWPVRGGSSAQGDLTLNLHVPMPYNPAAIGVSEDDRVLGIGVQAVGIFPLQAPVFACNELIRVQRGMAGDRLLSAGWHRPEAWGCWSMAPTASLHLAFDSVLAGALSLELNLAPPLADQTLMVVVNNVALPAQEVRNGLNIWTLPPRCYLGRFEMQIGLVVERTVCPADDGLSNDNRSLGVGLRSIRVFNEGE
ncbi:MAG: glycosyltransferase [Proteobacteria bacterium]|nr:glycosyltransferase [Pseudomonadota bacterium]